uniref:Ig-like domain-containing protein n=1 Tax=Denticeps clupeoides TaxID=299321 RepID=A0AAY4D564_9TELE
PECLQGDCPLLTQTLCLICSAKYEVVGPSDPVAATVGEDLILPCSLKPNISAVDMIVEWTLAESDQAVHLFHDGADDLRQQIPAYYDRTTLFREELKRGNISLKLSRVQISDGQKYRCFVVSNHASGVCSVQVVVVGTKPVVSAEGHRNGRVSLVCESTGWNPASEVEWLDSEGTILRAEPIESHRDTEDFSVKRRVTVEEGDTHKNISLTCRVSSHKHTKEEQIHVPQFGCLIILWEGNLIQPKLSIYFCSQCSRPSLKNIMNGRKTSVLLCG